MSENSNVEVSVNDEQMELIETRPSERSAVAQTAFSSIQNFESAQRMAKALSSSDLVPKQYAGNIPNCIIALEMSQRLGANPLMIMQNLYVVHNRPAWSSQFMIACVNGSGRFSPLRYEITGKPLSDDWTCVAWAYDKGTGEKLCSPKVSIRMAKAEGWYNRNGSKWLTMPELMMRYRAATFFGRTYCPELTMGMHTVEEIKDIGDAVVVDGPPVGRHSFGSKKEDDKKQEKPEPSFMEDEVNE